MLSFLSRSFVRPRPGFRRLFKSTLCTQSATRNVANNVYMNENECLVIKWSDGDVNEFPYVYLRENCRCSLCYTDGRKSRTMYSPKDVDLNITARSADWNTDDDQLEVNWVDGHASYYSSEWLKYLRYRPPGEGQPHGVIRKKTKLWGSEMSVEGNMPTFQFDKLLNDEHELYKWLVTLITQTGIAKVQNAPKERDQLKTLGEKVGYLASTGYGSTSEIRAFSELSAESHETGYSDSYLAMHTDFSYTNVVPMIAMSHCIEQTKSEGGASLFADAFHAVKLLHEESPELFQILATTPIVFRNFTKTQVEDMYWTSIHPLIRVKQVCYRDDYRDTNMPLEPKLIKSFYKAYFRFSELLADRRTSFSYKMEAGDIMTFSNYRVLHGRSQFKHRSDNVRLLELAYFDEDCAHSKLRYLADKQGLQSPLD